MSDTLPVVWESTPHTVAKHRILTSYLEAWVTIMSHHLQRSSKGRDDLLVVDGFAGPGKYAGGEAGSPILSLRSVLDHSQQLPLPVRFLFVEERPDRRACLESELEALREEVKSSSRVSAVDVLPGDCSTVLNAYIDSVRAKGKALGPGFFFLDQFGYADVPMSLIQKILKEPMTEVFSYLSFDWMNRFMTDETKWPTITTAFGSEQWKEVFRLEKGKRQEFILETYRQALKEVGHARFVWHFAMCDEGGKLIYWLFFCSNSLRGLEEMKKAMRKVDRTGGFRFSDRESPDQLSFLSDLSDEMLSRQIHHGLRGQTLSVKSVKEYVLTQTPGCNYKTALGLLEERHKMVVVNPPLRRRAKSYAVETMRIRFLP